MSKSLIICLCLIGCSWVSWGQTSVQATDTLMGPTVPIIAPAFSPTFKDSIRGHELRALGPLGIQTALESRLGLDVKTYGWGGLSSAGISGGLDRHQHVVWEGVSLNNAFTGTADLNLMPSFLFNEVRVSTQPQPGGQAGLTGQIELVSGDKASGSNIGLYGIPGALTTAYVQQRSNGMHTKLSSTVYGGGGDQSLKDGSGARIPHTSTGSTGVMQQYHWSRGKMQSDFNLWAQARHRQLPPSLSRPADSLSAFMDRNLVSSAGLTWVPNRHWKLQARQGFHLGNFDYTDPAYSIMARVYWYRWSPELKASRVDASGNQWNAGTSLDQEHVESDTYSQRVLQRISRNSLEWVRHISLTPNWDIRINTAGQVLYRLGSRELYPGAKAGTYFFYRGQSRSGAGMQWSRSVQYPTLNDLYFAPGGNPDLKPETLNGWDGEVFHQWTILPNLRLKGRFSGFAYHFQDWIAWRPGVNPSIWTATNIPEVRSRGFRVEMAPEFKHGKHTGHAWFRYRYTQSTIIKGAQQNDPAVGNQWIYLPFERVNTGAGWERGPHSIQLTAQYRGFYFVNTSNTRSHPAHWLVHFSAGTGWGPLRLDLSLQNVFNTYYQNLPNYPMPGRFIMLGMAYQL